MTIENWMLDRCAVGCWTATLLESGTLLFGCYICTAPDSFAIETEVGYAARFDDIDICVFAVFSHSPCKGTTNIAHTQKKCQ